MPVIKTTTVSSSGNSASVHTISFKGISGGIFFCLALALVLYVVGFATTGWTIVLNSHFGLWESCVCGRAPSGADWFRAVQAMIIIGHVGLVACMICVFIYMCVHAVNKTNTILALTIICFVTVLFMLVGFIVYGAKATNVSWSFVLCVVGGIFTLIAGVLSVVQMRQSRGITD
ncbi:unnamed protein product [Owenia fusiformis]|uniref:Uncharacterized protein n=1 Tax=Owenia fusiformis TaxID=6347 RepID=A0A8S4PTT9_OWEFU|nr:unnamed protein product [Owenia fusiformis]